MPWKRIAIITGVICVIATPIVLLVATSPTPMERARELRSIDAVELSTRGPRFTEWVGPEKIVGGARLEARYGEDHSFEIHVLADDGPAKAAFLSEMRELEGWDQEVQAINTFGGELNPGPRSEYCAREGEVIRCVGYVPDKPIFVSSEGPVGDDDFTMLGLLRIAGKHWSRVD